ncbi:MAG: hypothetical protein KGJ86_06755 [Chloroflexota bacterium]|nr:hypothetical protein [Chloroflexota bacterium]
MIRVSAMTPIACAAPDDALAEFTLAITTPEATAPPAGALDAAVGEARGEAAKEGVAVAEGDGLDEATGVDG